MGNRVMGPRRGRNGSGHPVTVLLGGMVDAEHGTFVGMCGSLWAANGTWEASRERVTSMLRCDDVPEGVGGPMLCSLSRDMDKVVAGLGRSHPALFSHMDGRAAFLAVASRFCELRFAHPKRPIRVGFLRRWFPEAFRACFASVTQEAMTASWKRRGFFHRLHVGLEGMLLHKILCKYNSQISLVWPSRERTMPGLRGDSNPNDWHSIVPGFLDDTRPDSRHVAFTHKETDVHTDQGVTIRCSWNDAAAEPEAQVLGPATPGMLVAEGRLDGHPLGRRLVELGIDTRLGVMARAAMLELYDVVVGEVFYPGMVLKSREACDPVGEVLVRVISYRDHVGPVSLADLMALKGLANAVEGRLLNYSLWPLGDYLPKEWVERWLPETYQVIAGRYAPHLYQDWMDRGHYRNLHQGLTAAALVAFSDVVRGALEVASAIFTSQVAAGIPVIPVGRRNLAGGGVASLR